MNETEEREYTEQIEQLYVKLQKRNEKIALLQKNLSTMESYEELDDQIKKLDILLKESKLDRELSDDIQNMLEVEHFLECGNGQNFDPEY
jgi:hypothetical protein